MQLTKHFAYSEYTQHDSWPDYNLWAQSNFMVYTMIDTQLNGFNIIEHIWISQN